MFEPKSVKPRMETGVRLPNSVGRSGARRVVNSPARHCGALQISGESGNARKAPDISWDFSRVSAYAHDRVDRSPLSTLSPAKRPVIPIQAKPLVGQVNDPLEDEADRVADQVMQGCASHSRPSGTPRISRKNGDIGGTTTSALVLAALRSPGYPLPAAERAFFEPRLGQELSRVRVHSDELAARSSAALGAAAYTSGPHIVVARNQYDPGSARGRQLIAHELAHVVQQASGAAQGVQQQPNSGPAGAEASGPDTLTKEQIARTLWRFQRSERFQTKSWPGSRNG